MSRKSRFGKAVFVFVVSALLAGLLSIPVGASHVACGHLVTGDTTLDADLVCAGTALVIGADGITLDLGGHSIRGSGGSTGVSNTSGYDNVTITNGTVENFTRGVWMINAFNATVTMLDLDDNFSSGIEGRNTDSSLISQNTITGSRRGVLLWTGSNGNTITQNDISESSGPPGNGAAIRVIGDSEMNWITRNIVTNNEFGIDIGAADDNYILQNKVSRSTFDGVFISNSSDNTTVEQNSSDRNGRFGIRFLNNSGTVSKNHTWFNGDLGIIAGGGVLDGGGNSAKHNGDPNQCSPHISC